MNEGEIFRWKVDKHFQFNCQVLLLIQMKCYVKWQIRMHLRMWTIRGGLWSLHITLLMIRFEEAERYCKNENPPFI